MRLFNVSTYATALIKSHAWIISIAILHRWKCRDEIEHLYRCCKLPYIDHEYNTDRVVGLQERGNKYHVLCYLLGFLLSVNLLLKMTTILLCVQQQDVKIKAIVKNVSTMKYKILKIRVSYLIFKFSHNVLRHKRVLLKYIFPRIPLNNHSMLGTNSRTLRCSLEFHIDNVVI